jgi:hypothetical protein
MNDIRPPNLAPEAVVYSKIKLTPVRDFTENFLRALKKELTLKLQGEAVEFFEDTPLPLLMLAFDLAKNLCPEAVLRLKTGERVLLFDHQGVPVLRDEGIIQRFAKKEEKELKNKEFVSELVLNLEEIWEGTLGRDYFERIELALEKAENLFRPAIVTTFIGKAPALLFLLVQERIYGKSAEIYYQEGLQTKAINITLL